jgi:hypothetical protein
MSYFCSLLAAWMGGKQATIFAVLIRILLNSSIKEVKF